MHYAASMLKVLLFTITIPALGFIVSFWILSDVDGDLMSDGLPGYQQICANEQALKSPEVRGACTEWQTIEWLGHVSIIAAALGILIPVVFWLASLMAGASRSRIAVIFPPLVLWSLITISISVLLQGGIFTYGAYIAEAYAFERVHYFIIFAIGIGALVAAVKLIMVSFTFGKPLTTGAIGKPVSASACPSLFSFVNGLAESAGAEAPDNIVIGLEPTFYVTSCDVQVPGMEQPLKGQSLYLSAPLMRLMSRNEMAAIVGHELGHFSGDDTVYSLKFAPVYAGLGSALEAMEGAGEGVAGLAKLPAKAALSFMYEIFSRNERTIGRERELRADRVGASVSSPMDLATSLVKVSLYAGLWGTAQEQNVERLNDGKVSRNLSKVFQDLAKYDVEHESIDEIMASVLQTTIAHPTDTHPSVAARLEASGVAASEIDKDKLLVPPDSVIEVLDNSQAIEEEITVLEHQMMMALGYVASPGEDDGQEDYLLKATYCLAAAMVAADGKIEPEEIAVAEAIGAQLFEAFDATDFREYCNHPEDFPDAANVAAVLNDALEDEGKVLILRYLREISQSDADVDARETQLLAQIADTWQVALEAIDQEAANDSNSGPVP